MQVASEGNGLRISDKDAAQGLCGPIIAERGISVLQEAAIHRVIDHGVREHNDILVGILVGDGLELLVEPDHCICVILYRSGAIWLNGAIWRNAKDMIISDGTMAAFKLLPHILIKVGKEVIVTEDGMKFRILGYSLRCPEVIQIHVMVADGVNHRHFDRIKHPLIEGLESRNLAVRSRIHKVAHHHHGIKAVSVLLGSAILQLGESVGKFRLRSVSVADVRVGNGAERQNDVVFVETRCLLYGSNRDRQPAAVIQDNDKVSFDDLDASEQRCAGAGLSLPKTRPRLAVIIGDSPVAILNLYFRRNSVRAVGTVLAILAVGSGARNHFPVAVEQKLAVPSPV